MALTGKPPLPACSPMQAASCTARQILAASGDGIGFELSPVVLLVGDYNDDGVVDGADYTVWRDHLGQTYALANRSAANSGPIGTSDFTTWKSQFGQHAGNGSGASTYAAVPEPATLWMLLVGILTMSYRRGPNVP